MPTAIYDGTVLRRARETQGLSREQLAVQAGVTYPLIVRTELYRPPRPETLITLCRLLGITVDDCFTENE
jgi:transcriptional regulator with XRE-family HTH domain